MKNVAIITAKGGNQTLANKNIYKILGKPSVGYSIEAAIKSKLIDEVYVSTECDSIKEVAMQYGVKIINRPINLSQPLSNHGDVIVHAVEKILEQIPNLFSATILLGNTVMATAADIDKSIEALLSKDIDSCMTVWKAQDDHPFRAMTINEDGYLSSFSTQKDIDTNRQSYPDVYFYDQGPWSVKVASLMKSKINKDGPSPWWWMGKKCFPIERLWVTGRDIHTLYDVEVAEWWLNNYLLRNKQNPSSAEHYNNGSKFDK